MKFCVLCFSLVMAWVSAASAQGFDRLAPHRAVYNVKMLSVEDRSGISAMDGRMVYELLGNSCDGMSMQYRFVTRIRVNRDLLVTDHQMATHESGDGTQFTFSSKSFVNQQKDQNVSGVATKSNGGIQVVLNGDSGNRLDLSDGAFSSSHLVIVLEQALAGENFVTQPIFDGAGGANKVINTTAVIGKSKVVESPFKDEAGKDLKALMATNAWPVTLSYFDKAADNRGEGTPSYQADFLLYENGITRNLTMRYPDYSLLATLSEFEYLEKQPCN